jgi:hypothetical protein
MKPALLLLTALLLAPVTVKAEAPNGSGSAKWVRSIIWVNWERAISRLTQFMLLTP